MMQSVFASCYTESRRETEQLENKAILSHWYTRKIFAVASEW